MAGDDGTNSSERSYSISVVIPVLNEVERINDFLEKLFVQGCGVCAEIIVVDGDAGGSTVNAIVNTDVVKITAERGRGRQMNAGADAATGEIVLFLHGDTELPEGAFERIVETMRDGRYVGGAFDLGVDTERVCVKFIAACSRVRNRLLGTPFGDQGIFLYKNYFDKIGQYKDIELMEDVELMRRIKKRGDRICILGDRVSTSSRRWETDGVLYTTLRNQVILMLYYLGVCPNRLARFYRSSYGRRRKQR